MLKGQRSFPVWLLFAVTCFLGPPLSGASAPRVVVSIGPIHSLVAAVMEGIAVPELLVSGGQSPHAFSLRPSDMRKLNKATLVFWVGRDLERPLEKVLASRTGSSRAIAFTESPGMELLPIREGGAWAHHDGEREEDDAGPDAGHSHPSYDPHIWLSPTNAARIVALVTEELVRIDPGNEKAYRQNAHHTLERLERMDREIDARLAGVRDRPYIVFHDAYQLFEHHYRLTAVGAVTVSPEGMPGARRIRELRDQIQRSGAVCVFSEPQFNPRLTHMLIEGTSASAGVLDPLGVQQLGHGANGYFLLMNALADALVDCLEG